MNNLKKVVLITGANNGFGREIAEYTFDKGHIVYATHRDISNLGNFQRKCTKDGCK